MKTLAIALLSLVLFNSPAPAPPLPSPAPPAPKPIPVPPCSIPYACHK